jgi:ParB family chromosome partitioning protein
MAGFNDAMQGNMAAALGRRGSGLTATPSEQGPRPFDGRKSLPGACQIEIDRLVRDPDQPRTEFSEAEIEELAASFRDRGQLQPIRCRWDPALGKYVIILGERRYRAAIKAGLDSLACVVVEDAATPEDRLEDQIIENMLRVDLKPIEQANSYRRLMAARGYTQAELAARLRIKRESVTQAMQLLELPAPIQEAVDDGKISPSAAYEIGKVADPQEQARIADEAIAGTLKRAEVRERVARANGSKGRGAGKGKASPAKLPTERKYRATNGIRIVGDRRKGFDLLAWIEALREAMSAAEAALAGQDEADAA